MSYIFSKKLFLYFRKRNPAFFSPGSKNKKISCFNIDKFPIFSQKKAFFIFREIETPKKFLYFRKRNFLIFQETSYVSRSNFQSSKNEKSLLLKSFFYFWKRNVPTSTLINSLYFRRNFKS